MEKKSPSVLLLDDLNTPYSLYENQDRAVCLEIQSR